VPCSHETQHTQPAAVRIEQMEHVDRPVATYREFTPRAELRADVEAIFSFVPRAPAIDRRVSRQVVFRTGDSFCAPRVADGSASIALELGMTCAADGLWCTTGRVGGFVIGPMRGVGPAVPAQCPLMVGVYLKPGRVATFTGVPAAELTDNVLALEDLWRSDSALAGQLADLDERERIAHPINAVSPVTLTPGSDRWDRRRSSSRSR
jgi:hypothetical protein